MNTQKCKDSKTQDLVHHVSSNPSAAISFSKNHKRRIQYVNREMRMFGFHGFGLKK